LSKPFDVRYKNDFSPVFAQNSLSESTFPEDVNPGQVLGTFTATDQDPGSQSSVKYSIQPNLGYLAIDRNTGVLTVAKSLDREMTNEIAVAIVATDSAPTPFHRSTEHAYKLILSDLNDNNPVFNASKTRFDVKESTAVGDVVVVITASDADDGDNARLTYEMVSHNDTVFFEFRSDSASFIAKGKDIFCYFFL